MDNIYLTNIVKAIFVVFSAVIGSLSTFSLKLDHHKLCALISLSAGALLGAALFAILPEALEGINLYQVLLSMLSGYILFWLISKYYFHICPACSASHFDEQTTKKFSEIVLLMMTALAFHSLFDGIALTTRSTEFKFDSSSIFVAILIHKFPEGLALASLMFGANYTKGLIIRNVILVEFATVIGALIGILLIKFNISDFMFGLLMAHIAGGFVYLAIHAILGEMLKHHTKLVVTFFSLGLFFILITSLVVKTI